MSESPFRDDEAEAEVLGRGMEAMSLGAAWAEAEAALPEGWWMERLERQGTNVEYTGGRMEHVDWWTAVARGPKDAEQRGQGTWPAVALKDLAAKFR